MCVPDPVELMNARIEDLIYEFDRLQKGVPEGKFVCPGCKKICDGEPIEVSPSPYSPVCCYDCLPDDSKAAYDKFFGT